MADPLSSTLQKHFGHTAFRPLQREIIESVLQGSPTLAILPTGGGKSLTYQLPALLLDGLTLVISPLISLIQDQTLELERKGIPVGKFDSTLSSEQRRAQLRALDEGRCKLFYTSPESLANPQLLEALKRLHISLIAIDEAHCISDWGHSFRPSYLYLPKVVRTLKPDAVLALTATATRKTASEIRKLFGIKTAQQFASSHQRPNLSFRVIPCSQQQKDTHLLACLQSPHNLPAIVYAMRQEDCEAITHLLSKHGFEARSYHAGLNTTARAAIQNNFLAGSVEIVVSTIAFGMGVDKPNIRSVIHYHLPKSPEGWMQESGRAGRDGNPSTCTLLACGDDLIPLENFIHAKEVKLSQLQQLLESLYIQGKHAKISPYQTRVRFDFPTSVFDLLIARLELLGHIRFAGTSWRYIRAWPVVGKQLALSTFPPKTRKALEHIFSLGDRYDTEQATDDFQLPPDKLWAALHQLRDEQSIVYKPSGWFWHYTLRSALTNTSEIAQKLLESFQTQTLADHKKLEAVERIATSRACIPNALAQWFGEKAQHPCGICSSCLKQSRPRKLPAQAATISNEQLATIHQLLISLKKRIHTPQQLTRFLCGIPSPYLRHYWLNRRPEFGMLSHLPYADVNAYAQTLIAQ